MILQEIDNMPPVKRGKRGVSSAEDEDDDYRKRRDRNNELQDDMSISTKLEIMKCVKEIKMKEDCRPSKFDLSSETSNGIHNKKLQQITKRRRSSIIREIEDNIARNNEILNDDYSPQVTPIEIDSDCQVIEEEITSNGNKNIDGAVKASTQKRRNVKVRTRSKGIQTDTSELSLSAVKKSRFKSKQRTQETFTRVNKLKAENQMLEEKVKTLTKDLEFLKTLFMEYASKSDSKFEGIDLEKLLAETPEEKAGSSSKS